MEWVYFALAAALVSAFQDVYTKAWLKELSGLEMLAGLSLFCLPFAAAGLGWSRFPALEEGFWPSFWADQVVHGLGMWLFMEALRRSPASLTLPLLAFAPLFQWLLGWALLGESPEPVGAVGIGLIVGGSYLLFLGRGRGGWLGPLKALGAEPGAMMMLGVAWAFAWAVLFGKVAVVRSEPLWHAFFYTTVQCLWILALAGASGRVRWRHLWALWPQGLTLGAAYMAHMTLHNLALIGAVTAYMVAVKRLNLVFAVLMGRWALGEKQTVQRLLAAAVMVSGVALIAYWGR